MTTNSTKRDALKIARLAVKVSPKASRNAIRGWMSGALKISVTAAPERGKANAAVIELLAQALGVPKSSVRVVRGHTDSRKLVEVEGLAQDELHGRLGGP